ncbi:MAG: DUF3617 family protein [Alcanivorax sp.]|nr:DUF3617 family protein [Alcanivorax sp.]
MKRLIITAGLAALAALAMPVQAMELKPGRWQQTTTLDAPNLPAKMRTQQSTDCISADDAADLKAALQHDWKANHCTLDNADESGNTLTWSASCQQANVKTRMTGTLKAKNSTHYSMDMKFSTPAGKTMTSHSDAKWVSECKNGAH